MAGRFSVEAIFKLTDRMTRPVAKIQKRIQRMTQRASAGLRRLDRAFGRVGKAIKRTGLIIAGAAAGAVVALRNIAGVGGDFEQAITNVGAVSLKTRDQIAALEKQALALGESTKFTATEVASAQEIMAKSGFKTQEILGGLPGVLDAAAASGLEIAEVADVVSSALKGMGLATTESVRVADVLALASSRTNSTIGSLGESLKNVATTAKRLNVPFEEAVAGVALLQDVGLDASVAGSAMNVMLTKLAKPPAAVSKQMRKFGISFRDAKGDMLPFQEVIGNISKAAKKSGGNLDQVGFLAELVGLRGQKAAGNLADLFEAGKLQTLTKELQNAEGAAAKMAAIRMDTTRGDLLKLGAATDGVKIALFDLESGPLRKTIQSMTEWVGVNKKVIVSGVEDFIADVRANLPDIVKWLKRIGTALGAFFALAAAVKVAQVAVAAFSFTMQIATGIWKTYLFMVKATKIAIELYRVATLLAMLATQRLGMSALATGISLGGMRTALNASKMGAAINGITGKLGKAGLLGAAAAVGFAFGSWLNHQFGIDKMISGWLASLKGFNTAIESIGKTLGIDAITDIGKGARKRLELREQIGVSTERGTGLNDGSELQSRPQVVSPQERVSREILESTATNREQLDVTLRDETGRAEVTRKPRNFTTVDLQSSGAF